MLVASGAGGGASGSGSNGRSSSGSFDNYSSTSQEYPHPLMMPSSQHFTLAVSETAPTPASSSSVAAADEDVFTCHVCQKGFEKRTSRDRHTRRCRKKRPEDTIPRKKSCSHCASSKARCDQRRPQCTRCRSKGLACQYAYLAPSDHSPVQQNHHHLDGHHNHHPIDLGFAGDSMLLGDVDMNMGSDLFAGWETQQVALARPPSPHMYSSLDTPLSDSCCINPAINMSRPVGSPSPVPAYNFDQPTFYPSPDKSSSPDTSSTSPSCCSQSHDHHLPGLDTPSPASSPDCTSITKLTDPLTNPRPVPSYPQLELISRLLSSFPTLLKKPTTAPPFIHRSRLLPGHRAEALANVTALVHMSSVKSPESKSFVAAMITSEFERIEKTVLTLTSGNGPSGWAAIENYQALVVLALLRYFSGDLLVRDLTAMETLSVRIGFEGMFTNGELPPNESWEDWLIAESKRRTFVIVFLLGRLFHYRAGLLPLSCDGTGAVQLPACRSMWEAMSAKDWTEETEAVFAWPGWDTGRRKWMTFQDLEKGEAKMAVWYAGMDALGMVIMADALVKKDVGETISATCHGGKVRGCLEGLEGMEGMEGMEGL